MTPVAARDLPKIDLADSDSPADPAIPVLVSSLANGAVHGSVVNSDIAGATVFIDTNGNGKLDAGEVSTQSDVNGRFVLPANAPSGTIFLEGGIDLATRQANTAILKAPVGATTVNPFTTLVQTMIDTGVASTEEQAQGLLFAALKLPQQVSLSAFDPIQAALHGDASTQAAAVALEAKAVEISNLVQVAQAALAAARVDPAQAQSAALQALAKAVASSAQTGLDLSLVDTVKTVLEGAVKTAAPAAQQTTLLHSVDKLAPVVAATNAVAESAQAAYLSGKVTDPVTTLSDVFKVATLVQSQVAPAVEKAVLFGGLDSVVDAYGGQALIRALSHVRAGQIAPDVPANAGSEITNPGVSLVEAETSVDGKTIVLSYDEVLDRNHGPTIGAFTVKVGDTADTLTPVKVTGVGVSGMKVTLTLATAVLHGQQVTVSYTDPHPDIDDADGVIQDRAGNDAASQSDRPVHNTVPDTSPPMIADAAIDLSHATDPLPQSTVSLFFSEPVTADRAKISLAYGVQEGGVWTSRTLAPDTLRFHDNQLDFAVPEDLTGKAVKVEVYSAKGQTEQFHDLAGNSLSPWPLTVYVGSATGSSTLQGGEEGDVFVVGKGTGKGPNQLDGGQGDDVFLPNLMTLADDTFVGGAGNDELVFFVGNGNDLRIDTKFGKISSVESLHAVFTPGSHASVNLMLSDAFVRANAATIGSNQVYTVQADDLGGTGTLTVDGAGVSSPVSLNLSGTSRGDTLLSGPGNDVIHGNGGDDFIRGGLGSDVLYGDDGNDTLSAFGQGRSSLYGGAGDDDLSTWNPFYPWITGEFTLVGGPGNDSIRVNHQGTRGESSTNHIVMNPGDGTAAVGLTVISDRGNPDILDTGDVVTFTGSAGGIYPVEVISGFNLDYDTLDLSPTLQHVDLRHSTATDWSVSAGKTNQIADGKYLLIKGGYSVSDSQVGRFMVGNPDASAIPATLLVYDADPAPGAVQTEALVLIMDSARVPGTTSPDLGVSRDDFVTLVDGVLTFTGTPGTVTMTVDKTTHVATFTRGDTVSALQPALDAVTKITVPFGWVLQTTASELDGRTLDGDGSVETTLDAAGTHADLSGVTTNRCLLIVPDDFTFSGELSANYSHIAILPGKTLTLGIDQANHHVITTQGGEDGGIGHVALTGEAHGQVTLTYISTDLSFVGNELKFSGMEDGAVSVNAGSVSGDPLSIVGTNTSKTQSLFVLGTSDEETIDLSRFETVGNAQVFVEGNGGADTILLSPRAKETLFYGAGYTDGGFRIGGDTIYGFSAREDSILLLRAAFGGRDASIDGSDGKPQDDASRSSKADLNMMALDSNGVLRISDPVSSDWSNVASVVNAAIAGTANGINLVLVLSNGSDSRVYFWNDGASHADSRVEDAELTSMCTLVGVRDATAVDAVVTAAFPFIP